MPCGHQVPEITNLDFPGEFSEFAVLRLRFALHELSVDVIEMSRLPLIPTIFPRFRLLPSILQQVKILNQLIIQSKNTIIQTSVIR